MGSTECLFRFLFAFVTDTGTQNVTATVGKLLNTIVTYQNKKPPVSQLGLAFSDFSNCVEPNLTQAARTLAETIVFALVVTVILAVLTIVIFLGALFWYNSTSIALVVMVCFLLFLFFAYYYVQSRVYVILNNFQNAVQPCLVTLSNQLQTFQSAEVQAIRDALCPSS